MSRTRRFIQAGFAAALVAGLTLAAGFAPSAMAQYPGGLGDGRFDTDSRNNRMTVSIRVVPVGNFCVRAVEAVGYDPRSNQSLYRVRFDSGAMTSLGVTAFENAFSSARSEGDAVRALSAAQADARPYRRSPTEC
jgi:hypothetical protein